LYIAQRTVVPHAPLPDGCLLPETAADATETEANVLDS